MKERRKAGATHSFRLTREAADIVDNLNHPRNLGGKSRLISDAIVYYFQESKDVSVQMLLDDIEHLENMRDNYWLRAKKPESEPSPPAWWRRFFALFARNGD
jgi:hypothetical protein